jgi:hypothetical protein
MYSANEPVERRVAVSDEAIEMARRVDDPTRSSRRCAPAAGCSSHPS